jgi:hypothetical protein
MGETGSLSGLPVDGLETILKVAGWAKLPFADDSPDGCAGCDARGGDDETNDDGFGEERGIGVGSCFEGRRWRFGRSDENDGIGPDGTRGGLTDGSGCGRRLSAGRSLGGDSRSSTRCRR